MKVKELIDSEKKYSFSNIKVKVPDYTMIDLKEGEERECTEGFIVHMMGEWFITPDAPNTGSNKSLYIIGDWFWLPKAILEWEVIEIITEK